MEVVLKSLSPVPGFLPSCWQMSSCCLAADIKTHLVHINIAVVSTSPSIKNPPQAAYNMGNQLPWGPAALERRMGELLCPKLPVCPDGGPRASSPSCLYCCDWPLQWDLLVGPPALNLHAVLAVPGGDQLPPDCPEACDLTSFDDSEGERDCGTLIRNLQLLSKYAKQLSKYM